MRFHEDLNFPTYLKVQHIFLPMIFNKRIRRSGVHIRACSGHTVVHKYTKGNMVVRLYRCLNIQVVTQEENIQRPFKHPVILKERHNHCKETNNENIEEGNTNQS